MSEVNIVGRNEKLQFWSTVGLKRDVIDGGGVDGTVRRISDREIQESALGGVDMRDLEDAYDSHVEVCYNLADRHTEVRFRGAPVIHSLNWEGKNVEY